ncbi:ribosomal protein S18-alanine N-acetyltransferase [Natronosporangium hydrolyticum]|uniref:[Ribosomal protein bS18]-alanine N-acetyltransferase n=1 Tax=Natronosporangium hydrolyticum TaxID=2811111 RepID=A0A895YHM2_9ACTN|nr:ribosomal protein S18-alanine N-acetyltransferase [Natronosporangium hydrolyticum]QSB15572.1 ribosomal protein S18-alanine N-acetyltransferase [Natronosporangium hydrolyticum]
MAQTIRVERMRSTDIDELLPIEQELFGAERWTAGMFRSELEQDHYYLVARDAAGVVLGYAGLAVMAPEEAWVNNLAVRRAAQRQGIGERLLTALLDEATRRGATRVLLEVAVDNAAAQQLYERHGFAAIAVRRGYYQPSNTDALVMARE